MTNKIKNVIFLIISFALLFLMTKYYFSENYRNFTHESRTNYLLSLNNNKDYLPILENDTSDIVIYKNDLNEFNNKKKRFWEKLKSNYGQ